MSQGLNDYNWQPTAQLPALQARAKLYQQIREFFAIREVLEVETPLLCARAVTDPYIQAFSADGKFLQTSPEYAMKRLLAAGSGSIYQICKAFRQEEAGNMHNPEFTMLEWYRPGFDHQQLMQEMDDLLQLLLDRPAAIKISYQQLFLDMVGIDPHTADIATLQNCANNCGINLTAAALVGLTVTDWLQLIMSHVIEPKMIGPKPYIVWGFPVPQAALARIIPGECPVAARFEVYIEGIECANGYYELQDANEQAKRFETDNATRIKHGINTMIPDERLLAALESGLPECSGVTLGLDRVLMLKLHQKSIANVLAFSIENA